MDVLAGKKRSVSRLTGAVSAPVSDSQGGCDVTDNFNQMEKELHEIAA